MDNALIGRHVSWQNTGKDGSETRLGTVVALAYDQTAQGWYALIEPDDGSEFEECPADKLRKAPR